MEYPAVRMEFAAERTKEDRPTNDRQGGKEENEDTVSQHGVTGNTKHISETFSSPVLLFQAPESHIPFGPFAVRHPPRQTLSPARGDNEATAPQSCTETCSSSSSLLPSERSQEGIAHLGGMSSRGASLSPSPVYHLYASSTPSFSASVAPCSTSHCAPSPPATQRSIGTSMRKLEDTSSGQPDEKASKAALSGRLLSKVVMSPSAEETGKNFPSLCSAPPPPSTVSSTCSSASAAESCPPSLNYKEATVARQEGIQADVSQTAPRSPHSSATTTPLVSWPSFRSPLPNGSLSSPCVGCASFGFPRVAGSAPVPPSSAPPSNCDSSAQVSARFLLFPSEISHPPPTLVPSPLHFPSASATGRCPSSGYSDPLPASPGDSVPSNSSVCTTPSESSQPSMSTCSLPVLPSPTSDESSLHSVNRPSISMVMHTHLLSKISTKPSDFTSPARVLPPTDPALFVPLSGSSRISSPASTDSVLSAGPPGLLAAYSAELLCEPQRGYQLEPRRVRFIEGREEWLLSEAASVNSLIALSDDGGGTSSVALAMPGTGAGTSSVPPAHPLSSSAYEYPVDACSFLPVQSQMKKGIGYPAQKPFESWVSPAREFWTQSQARSLESLREASTLPAPPAGAAHASRDQEREDESGALPLFLSARQSARCGPISASVVSLHKEESTTDEAHSTGEHNSTLFNSPARAPERMQAYLGKGLDAGYQATAHGLRISDSPIGEGVESTAGHDSSVLLGVSSNLSPGCLGASDPSTKIQPKTLEQGHLVKGFSLVSYHGANPHAKRCSQTLSASVSSPTTISSGSSSLLKVEQKTMDNSQGHLLMEGNAPSWLCSCKLDSRDVSGVAKRETSKASASVRPSERSSPRETWAAEMTTDRDLQENAARDRSGETSLALNTDANPHLTDALDTRVSAKCLGAKSKNQAGYISFVKGLQGDVSESHEGAALSYSCTGVIQKQMTSPAEAISVEKCGLLSSPAASLGTALPSLGRRRHQTAPPLSGERTRQGRLVTVRGRDGVLRRQSLHVPPCLSTTTPGKSCVRRSNEQAASRSSTSFSPCPLSSPSFSASLSSLLKRSLRRRRNRSGEDGNRSSRSDTLGEKGGKNGSRETSHHRAKLNNSSAPSSSSTSAATVFCSPHHLTRSLFPYFVVRSSGKQRRQEEKEDRGLLEKQFHFPHEEDDTSSGVCKDRFPTEQIFELPAKPEAYSTQSASPPASGGGGQTGDPQVKVPGCFGDAGTDQECLRQKNPKQYQREKTKIAACNVGLSGSTEAAIEETHDHVNFPADADTDNSLGFCSEKGTNEPPAQEIVGSAYQMCSSSPFLGAQRTRESRFSSFSSLPVNFGWRHPPSKKNGRTARAGSLPLLPRKGSQGVPVSAVVEGDQRGVWCGRRFEGFSRYRFARESQERFPSPRSLLGEDEEDGVEEEAASYPLQFLDIATPQASD